MSAIDKILKQAGFLSDRDDVIDGLKTKLYDEQVSHRRSREKTEKIQAELEGEQEANKKLNIILAKLETAIDSRLAVVKPIDHPPHPFRRNQDGPYIEKLSEIDTEESRLLDHFRRIIEVRHHSTMDFEDAYSMYRRY